MSTCRLLQVEPLELQFPFVLNKLTSCPIMLSNKTNKSIAFKALTTDPMKYCVKPNMGIILPHAMCEILVTMQAPKEIPLNMKCKDKFKFQSLVVDPGLTAEDITANMGKMGTGNLLKVEPSELTFPCKFSTCPSLSYALISLFLINFLFSFFIIECFGLVELKKEISCSIQLSNMTDKHIAFKVKTTHRKKYRGRPNMGIIMPRSRCNVTVTMQAQEEAPPDMKCKEKFVIQSVVVIPQATINDINTYMFNGSMGVVEESKLKVFYVSSPLSPNLVVSTSEGGLSARTLVTSERDFGGPDQELLRDEEIVRESGAWFLFGITVGLLIVVFWCLMKTTFSFIWSFLILVTVKMVTKIVSDSLEDWIVKPFVYTVLHFFFREHVPA